MFTKPPPSLLSWRMLCLIRSDWPAGRQWSEDDGWTLGPPWRGSLHAERTLGLISADAILVEILLSHMTSPSEYKRASVL